VLVVVCVGLALFSAAPARNGTSMNDRADKFGVGFRLPREHVACRDADVCAVEVEPNAPNKILDRRLGEAGVSTCCTRGGAGEALLDAAHESFLIRDRCARMGAQYFLDSHLGPPSVVVCGLPRS
jgi:hypothetical protein